MRRGEVRAYSYLRLNRLIWRSVAPVERPMTDPTDYRAKNREMNNSTNIYRTETGAAL